MQKTFLLSSLLFAALLPGQNEGASGAAPQPVAGGVPVAGGNAAATGESAWTRDFGQPGADGSFRARFSRDGAGLVFLMLLDHYKDVASKNREPHTKDDYLLLGYNGADHALRLVGAPGETQFPMDLATAPWQVRDEGDTVTFAIESGDGLVFEKVLRHDPSQRGFVLELVLRNRENSGHAAGGNAAFTLLGPALSNPHEISLLRGASLAIAAQTDGAVASLHPAAGKLQPFATPAGQFVFAGNTNRFFGTFLYPKDDAARAALQSVAVETVPPVDDPVTQTAANSVARCRFALHMAVPAPGGETRLSYGLYFGPKSARVFDTMANPELLQPVIKEDLASPCCFIEVPFGRQIARGLLWLLGLFHGWVGNWGVAIIMLTILVRGLLSPLNFRMQKSMRAYSARMAVLKPKLDALKTQYGDDQRAYQQAMVAFQREHKLMPPLGGCLPIFLTMPIYVGLFTALRTAYDLRQQPFVSWIDDLSVSDSLFALPFWPHVFNLLPLLWMGLMAFLTLRQPLPTDPQQRQMQSMMRLMPLIFGVMLYNYAAALLVYMVTSMLWTFVESAVIKRRLGPLDPNVAAMTPQTF